MNYQRPHYQTLLSRVKEARKFIQVIAGPRQVGKSTLVSQLLENISTPNDYCSADDTAAATTQWIHSVWDSARAKMKLHNEAEHLLIIDEIQKIDDWSEAVKAEWDKDTRDYVNLKVVLLGSSRLLMKKGLTESLAGRFELIRMGHWSFKEMRDAFDWNIDQYIYYGGYPASAFLIDDTVRWRNYIKDSLIESTIPKDVLMTTTIYKPALLRQLFEIGCSYSAKELSLTKILGQLQDNGNVTTLQNYLEALDESYLLKGIQKFSGDVARKYNSVPKFQVYNNALLNAYNTKGFEESVIDTELWGRLAESSIGAHLLNHSEADGYKVFYWRQNDNEVDYVIEKGQKIIAIEVKSGRKASVSGLKAFNKEFKPYLSLIAGTSGIPFEEFLSISPGELFR